MIVPLLLAARLCIAGSPCIDASGARIEVPPSATARTFVWTDEADITLGILKPGDTSIAKARASAIKLRWQPRRAVDVTVRDEKGTAWTFRGDGSPRTLHVDPGLYEITSVAEGYRRSVQRVKSTATIVLEPLPLLHGRVIDAKTEAPIAGAQVLFADDAVAAISAGDGTFSFGADPEKWPGELRVAAGGYATRAVPVPHGRVTTNLLDVALRSGATIVVTIERPATIGAFTLELQERNRLMIIATRQSMNIAADQATATFEAVEPGDYAIVAKGEQPHERFGVLIAAAAGEKKEVRMDIHPEELRLRVMREGVSMPGASVTLWNLDGGWQQDFTTGDDGTIEVATWQLGRFFAAVRTGAGTHRDERTITSDAAEWILNVSSRALTGIVTDAVTGKPIAGASIGLGSSSSGGIIVKTDANGRYLITPVDPGTFRMTASAEGYEARGNIRLRIAESQQELAMPLQLKPASDRTILVRNALGRPLEGAMVLDFDDFTQTGQQVTDASGIARINVPPGESRRVFVVPRDGSFAHAVLIGKRGEPQVIVVPDAPATLVVKTQPKSKQPIPNVWVVIRYNGMALPLEVQRVIAPMSASSRDGVIAMHHVPLGVYEMWPVGSQHELRASLAGLGPAAPVKIVAQPGMNTATLTFESATARP